MKFTCKKFENLSVYELYDIMALRAEVFVVEQNCPYQDADGKDLDGWHLMGHNTVREDSSVQGTPYGGEEELVAYTRLLPKGVSYENFASIGRVVNSPKVRGTGAGKILMEKSIAEMKRLFPNDGIKIGAQSYLLKFYESLGFESTGEEYLEDNIPHTSMVLKK